MVRKLVCATVSAALCLASTAPALAQDYRFTGFDAPRGATATINVRVPMGREQAHRASYGLTLGYGQTTAPQTLDGRTGSRFVGIADIRFSGTRLRTARVASFDLAHLDRDRRLNLTGGGIGTTTFLLGAVAAAAAICFVVTDCFDDDNEATPL
jgi:hypothetical protein